VQDKKGLSARIGSERRGTSGQSARNKREKNGAQPAMFTRLHDKSSREFCKPTRHECGCRGICPAEFENKGIFVNAVENENDAGIDIEKDEKETGSKKQYRRDVRTGFQTLKYRLIAQNQIPFPVMIAISPLYQTSRSAPENLPLLSPPNQVLFPWTNCVAGLRLRATSVYSILYLVGESWLFLGIYKWDGRPSRIARIQSLSHYKNSPPMCDASLLPPLNFLPGRRAEMKYSKVAQDKLLNL
jgi:hypothetical protein